MRSKENKKMQIDSCGESSTAQDWTQSKDLEYKNPIGECYWGHSNAFTPNTILDSCGEGEPAPHNGNKTNKAHSRAQSYRVELITFAPMTALKPKLYF